MYSATGDSVPELSNCQMSVGPSQAEGGPETTSNAGCLQTSLGVAQAEIILDWIPQLWLCLSLHYEYHTP